MKITAPGSECDADGPHVSKGGTSATCGAAGKSRPERLPRNKMGIAVVLIGGTGASDQETAGAKVRQDRTEALFETASAGKDRPDPWRRRQRALNQMPRVGSDFGNKRQGQAIIKLARGAKLKGCKGGGHLVW